MGMISTDILLLGMAGIAGIMAIILIFFALRLYRKDSPREDSSGAPEPPRPGERLEPLLEEDMSGGDGAASEPLGQLQPSAETWEPRPASEPISNTVATILRNPETGQIVLQVEGKPFISAQALKNSSVWPDVESALTELLRWLSEASDGETIGVGAEAPKVPKRKSMIDEINEILRGMGREASGRLRGVRLVEGTGGSVRVYVGIENYVLEDVPDPEVRRLIREAVQEWESRQ
jgi:hypothetical protein